MARRKASGATELPRAVVQARVLVGRDTIDTYYVIVEPSWEAVRAIYRPLIMPGVSYGVYDTTIQSRFLPEGDMPRYHETDRPLQSVLADIKSSLLEHGGSPEAVRLFLLVGELNEEELSMAKAKLGTKGAAPAAAKADKPKGKGNADALAAARAAKAEAGPDVRKITITNKENPYREGSGRAACFDALKGAKTVEDYKSAGGKVKYLSRWESEGRITLK